MDQKSSTTVARQATFDTDPERAKIKKGTLKLPVIQTDNDKVAANGTKHESGQQNGTHATSKPVNSSQQSAVKPKRDSSTDKRGKDNVNNHRKSDTNTVHTTSEARESSVSEKQKKLNALNKAHKQNNTETTEPGQTQKDTKQKSSVLNKLNAKRDKSPDKKQTPSNVTQTRKESPTHKSNHSQKHSDKVATESPATKNSKNQPKRDKSPQKEAAKHSLHDDKSQATKTEKESVEKKHQERSSRSPIKKAAINTTPVESKAKDESSKTSVKEGEKTKVAKRDQSPTKPVNISQKLSTGESDALKSLKAKKQLSQGTGTKATLHTTEGHQKNESEKSPAKKQENSQKSPSQTRQSVSPHTKGGINVAQSRVSASEYDSTRNTDDIVTNKAPVGTKLSDINKTTKANTHIIHKQRKVSDSSLLNDIPNEKEHADLTSAVELLVSEGAKYSNENDEKPSVNNEHLQSNNPKTSHKESSVIETDSLSSEINESADNLPELKDSIGQNTGRIDHSVINGKGNTKDIVRQTYIVSPSPTKLDHSVVNRPELIVEQIDIEAKPKVLKMQNESFEQVYAERNTLLKAEYTYRKRIKQLEEEANGFLRTIEDLTSENKLLRDRVDQLESRQRHNGDDSAYEKISELEKEKGQLEGRVKQLEHLANSNANVDESTDSMQKEIRGLKAQVIKLQTENQTVNEENVKLKAENYENVKKLHALEAEASSLAKSATTANSEKTDKREKDNAKVRHEKETLQKKVHTLEFENKSLSETLEQKKHELKEIMSVMKDENKFDNEIKDLQNQVLKLQQEKKDLESGHANELRTVTGELRQTKARLDDTSKEIYELKIKFDETEKEKKSLNVENADLARIKQAQKIEIENLKAEIERLKQQLREANDKYDQIVRDTKSTNSDLRNAKENAEELNKDLQRIIADKEMQISKLITQLDTSNKDREFVSQTLKKEKDNLTNENNRLKVFEANMGRMELELKQMVTKYEEAELKNKQLSIQIQDKGFEVSNLEQQVFELNMKLDNSSKRISHLDKEKRELEDDRRDWEVKKEKVNDIEASNKRLTDENRRLRSQIEMTSYSLDYKPSEPERDRPVVEAWTSDVSSRPSQQQALYVHKEKKKVTIVPHPTMGKRQQATFSKSKPARSSKSLPAKKEDPRSSVRSSRSLEDLRRTPDQKTPDSQASLPELQKETRLTTYGGVGGLGQTGYAQIHKNRLRTINKKVY